MRHILDFFIELFKWVMAKIFNLLSIAYEWFIGLFWAEKVVFLNGFLSVAAVVMPVIRFHIFNSWSYDYHPKFHYLIGIAILMFATIYFRNKYIFYTRVFFNAFYFLLTVYFILANELTKADPYELCAGFYINLAVPVIYIIFSVFSYLYRRE